MANHYDGLALIKEFLYVEEKFRAKTLKYDVKALQYLDQIRAQLINMELSFKNRLQVTTAPISYKAGMGMVKATAVGIVIAGFLMITFLLGRKLLLNLKTKIANSS